MMLLPFFSSGVAAVEKCQKQGEQPLEFRFFTDNNSWKENGWTLECEYQDASKELLWEVPIGSLESESQTEVIREAACVPDTATCTLRIFDAKGDGLQGSKNGDPSTDSFAGWFAFLHGATTIATYKNLDEPKFSELTYCVGPECDQEPQEIQADDENCQDIAYLAMQLDNNPQDTTYQLICGDSNHGLSNKKIIWDGKGFTEPGTYVEEEACLPKDACCEFIVTDNKKNGLTSAIPEDSSLAEGTRRHGFVYFEKNYDPLLKYDGSTGETFGVLTKTFGCDAETPNTSTEDQVQSEGVQESEDLESEVDATGAVEEEASSSSMVVETGNNVDPAFDANKESLHYLENFFGQHYHDGGPHQNNVGGHAHKNELVQDVLGQHAHSNVVEEERASRNAKETQ